MCATCYWEFPSLSYIHYYPTERKFLLGFFANGKFANICHIFRVLPMIAYISLVAKLNYLYIFILQSIYTDVSSLIYLLFVDYVLLWFSQVQCAEALLETVEEELTCDRLITSARRRDSSIASKIIDKVLNIVNSKHGPWADKTTLERFVF